MSKPKRPNKLPPLPEELEQAGQELAAEGMMYVGDQGRILADFRGERPRLLPEGKGREFLAAHPEAAAAGRRPARREPVWLEAFRGGGATYGDFLLAGPISEAFNLGAISLRLGGRRLVWDAAAMQVTNLPQANRHLTREYRPGWELRG